MLYARMSGTAEVCDDTHTHTHRERERERQRREGAHVVENPPDALEHVRLLSAGVQNL